MMIDVDNGAEIGEERMATMRLAGSVIAVLVSPTAAVHAQMMIVGNDHPDLYLPVEGVLASGYYGVIALTERLHRQLLEVVKLELDGLGIHDINNAQGLMLFNIGDAEMTIGELILRGCYLGSNMSYSVKKMVESGYLAQERSVHNLRSLHVRLIERGRRCATRCSRCTSAISKC